MEETFSLPVVYMGSELEMEAKLVLSGYIRRFHVLVQGIDLVFEKDDENNFRVINYTQDNSIIKTDLLQAIIHSLEQLSD